MINLEETTTTRKIANLDTICIEPINSSKKIIFLHGFGANNNDLASLVPYLKNKDPNCSYYFPNAPLELEVPGMPAGNNRAWFELDQEMLIAFQRLDFADKVPAGLKGANQKITSFINELDAPFENISLGGFSQGAILATDVALALDKDLYSLILLSATITSKQIWTDLSQKHQNLKVFQSHGEQDAVLDYPSALVLSDIFKKSMKNYIFHPFSGGHEIDESVIRKLNNSGYLF